MALAALDLFASVIADTSAVIGGFDALAVQDGGGGPAAPALGLANEHAQRVVDDGPVVLEHPLAEEMEHRLGIGKVGGKVAPRAAALGQIEDGIDDAPPVCWRASAFGGFGKHRLEMSPLGVGEIGIVIGDFHRPNSAAAKVSPRPSPAKSGVFFAFRENISFSQPGSGFFSWPLTTFILMKVKLMV